MVRRIQTYIDRAGWGIAPWPGLPRLSFPRIHEGSRGCGKFPAKNVRAGSRGSAESARFGVFRTLHHAFEPGSIGLRRIAAIEVVQAEVVDLGLDIFRRGRVDRHAQLLDQEFEEFPPR